MKNVFISIVTAAALMACGSNDDEDQVTPEFEQQEQPTTELQLQTDTLTLQVNLPSEEDVIADDFYTEDILTYNASVSTGVCNPSGQSEDLFVYFKKSEAGTWQVFIAIDEQPINIDGGTASPSGFTFAQLRFDESGAFLRQYPYLIKSEVLSEDGVDYQIELDFYSQQNTAQSNPFTVNGITANGC